MRVGYHPAVQRDVSRILRHYDRISPQLGDAFWKELMTTSRRHGQHRRDFILRTEDGVEQI